MRWLLRPVFGLVSLGVAIGCGDKGIDGSTGTAGTGGTASTGGTAGAGGTSTWTCGAPNCSQEMTSSCNCSAICGGHSYSQVCMFSVATYLCQCLVDGSMVGSCQSSQKTCDIEQGCCAPYFMP